MKTLALAIDERELSTIQAALLLLQEQIGALPEDISEMMREHGAPLTETQVGELARRLALGQMRIQLGFIGDPPRDETMVEIERSAALAAVANGT